MIGSVSVVVPCRIEFYDGVATLVITLCRGIEGVIVDQIVSAFNEAFNNVVQHSRLGENDQIEIQIKRDPAQMMLRIIDEGVAYSDDFIRNQQQTEESWTPREHGMGWTIIHGFMSEVIYERQERNILSMIRYLNPQGEAI